jgi:hypothetical protein
MDAAKIRLDLIAIEMHGGRDDVGRNLTAKLDDVFAEIRLDRIHSRLFERLVEADLFADHRFALGDRLGAEPPANLDYGGARLFGGAGKMHTPARLRDLGLVALEVEVEMSKRVILDVARRFTQRLEFRQLIDRALALGDEICADMGKRALQLFVLHRAHGIALEGFGGGMNGHEGPRCER